MKRPAIALAILALAALPLGTKARAADVPSAGMLKLAIPYNSLAINMMPMWTALELKLFQRYGIDATTEYASRSPILVASILSGETPFAIAGEDAVIAADLGGGDITLLVASTEKLFFNIMSTSDIKSVADLKGKKLGVTEFGTTTEFIARYVLGQAGLRSDKDATLLPMGAQANIFTGLKAKVIDAGVVGSDAILKAKEFAGFNSIASLLDYDLYFYTGSLVAKKSWVAAHPKETMNVVRGYLAGVAAVIRDKEAAKAALAKYTNTADPDAIEAAWAMCVKMLLRVPLPKIVAIQTGLDANPLPAAKKADPARFIDPSFVASLAQDGFIDSLYK